MKTKNLFNLFILFVFAAWLNQVHAQQTGIFQTYAVVNANGAGNVFYAGGINSDLSPNIYDETDFGNVCSLVLNGGEIKTFKNGGGDVFAAEINYRIYPAGSPSGAFTAINLPFNMNLANPGDQKWQETAAGVDVLDGLATGNYVLEVFWKASTSEGDKFDSDFGNNFQAYFTVVPLPEITSISSNSPICPGEDLTLSAECEVGGASSGFTRMAGIGGSFGTQAFNDVFAFGDRPGVITRISESAFNSYASAAALRADYDVLLFTWNSSTLLNADWTTRIEPFLALGGSVFFEDEKNCVDLAPGVICFEQNGSFGSNYELISPPPFPVLVANGVDGNFINHHLTQTSWPPWMQLYITGPSGSPNMAIAGIHPTGGGRLIVQGPDQDFHANRSDWVSNGTTNAPGNQYQFILNQMDFLTAAQAGITWTGPGGFTSNEASPTIPNATTANAGVYTATCTTDAGCTATASITVVIEDNTPPAITCPTNINVNNNPGNCSAVVNYTAPVGTDNCPNPTTALTSGLGPGATFPVGTTVETYTVTDGAGNSASCSFNVTVTDNQPPTITCPSNISVNNDPGICGATVSFSPTVNDNCPGATVTCTQASGTVFPVGTTPVSCTATDASGLTATCSFSVTVTDNQPPTVTCPADISVNNTPGACSAVVTYATPSIADNCPGGSVTCTPPSGSTFLLGSTTVTCTATDAVGLTSTCSFNVLVTDNQPPVISCPADVTVNQGDPTDPGATGNATATDNCGVSGVSSSDAPGVSPGCPIIQVINRTWTATDVNGNSATCVQVISVQQLPPLITISGPNAICLTDSETILIINGSAGDVVTFSDGAVETPVTLGANGDNTIIINPAPDITTTYSLVKVVSAASGCEFAISGSHTIVVLLVDCGSFPYIETN